MKYWWYFCTNKIRQSLFSIYIFIFNKNVSIFLQSKISKRAWVLHECFERVPTNIDTMKELLEYGLNGTDLPALIAIGKGEDGGRWVIEAVKATWIFDLSNPYYCIWCFIISVWHIETEGESEWERVCVCEGERERKRNDDDMYYIMILMYWQLPLINILNWIESLTSKEG